ncbi:hypothetical protein C4B63_21g90 [Trypanosoma cruzi]|uniref:Uncharacterized protein n=1 Tax=Trypanosoma cruzi TaxID=5693 RepID=A0A2V2VGN9_TRYCR|nr:hypothetical protein C4B63_21g90 [Trypanosoma cruzi]
MLALFAERVEKHPSCRASRRYHWPGPHHHSHVKDDSQRQRRRWTLTDVTGQSLCDIYGPTPRHSVSVTILTSSAVNSTRTTKNANSMMPHVASLAEPFLATETVTSRCHHHGPPNVTIHLRRNGSYPVSRIRRDAGGAKGDNTEYSEKKDSLQPSASALSRLADQSNITNAPLDSVRHNESDDATIVFGVSHTGAPAAFFSPYSTAQSGTADALTSTGTWLNPTARTTPVGFAELPRKALEDDSVPTTYSNGMKSVKSSLPFKEDFEQERSSKCDGRVEEDTGAMKKHSQRHAVMKNTNHGHADDASRGGVNKINSEFPLRELRGVAAGVEEVRHQGQHSHEGVYDFDVSERASQLDIPFCLYERKKKSSRLAALFAKAYLCCVEGKNPLTDEEPSSLEGYCHEEDHYESLDDSYHNDKEVFDALSITTTSSCAFGAGLASFRLRNHPCQSFDVDNNKNNNNNGNNNGNSDENIQPSLWTHCSTCVDGGRTMEISAYAAEEAIYELKVQAKRRNAALLAKYVASCRQVVPDSFPAVANRSRRGDGVNDHQQMEGLKNDAPAAMAGAVFPQVTVDTPVFVRHSTDDRKEHQLPGGAASRFRGIEAWLSAVELANESKLEMKTRIQGKCHVKNKKKKSGCKKEKGVA